MYINIQWHNRKSVSLDGGNSITPPNYMKIDFTDKNIVHTKFDHILQ